MRRQIFVLILLSAAASSAFAQLPFGLGLKGGIGLTNAYQDKTFTSTGNFSASTTRTYSDAKDYIIGPFAELRLPFGFGVEADALFRPLSFAIQAPGFSSSTRFSTWEFPILAKYRFKAPIARPYIDAGPAFRTTTENTQYLSNHGIAVGGGIDIKLLFLHLSPEIRYIRWGSDSSNAGIPTGTGPASFGTDYAHSNLNQVEFLVGLSF